MMEDDEIEMSREELQRWVRATVKKRKDELISKDVREKCDLLQSMLERREKRAAMLLNLSRSVEACEAIVKKQYSLLGWDYRDTDTDDDNTNRGISTPPQCEVVTSSTAANTLALQNKDIDKMKSLCLKRKAMVVLTRLPTSKNISLHAPTPQNHRIKDEPFGGSDSTTQWTLDPSNDCDSSVSGYKPLSKMRRKVTSKNKTFAERDATTQTSTKSDAESDTMKTSAPKAKESTKKESDVTKSAAPQASGNPDVKNQATKTPTKPAESDGGTPSGILSPPSQSSIKTSPNVPQGEICVNMNVIARRKFMSWKVGKVIDKVTKNGRLKYKVSFGETGKSLVSGHHIAFDSTPHVQDLFVGARVVVRCGDDQARFRPGIVAEIPCRNNHLRCLVFLDDLTALYAQTISVRLVCRPLPNPLDDIINDTHRKFLEDYLKVWPNQPRNKYKVGQTVHAEFNGVQQMCEVLAVDCSLVQVGFQEHERKEWIYYGSIGAGKRD